MEDTFSVLGWTVPKIGSLFGALLLFIGIISYIIQTANPRSITALIPAFMGVPMLALGILAIQNADNRHHYMHASMVFALVMILGGARVFFSDMSTLAATSHLLLIVTGSSFTFVGIKSFRHARIQREGLVGSQ